MQPNVDSDICHSTCQQSDQTRIIRQLLTDGNNKLVKYII